MELTSPQRTMPDMGPFATAQLPQAAKALTTAAAALDPQATGHAVPTRQDIDRAIGGTGGAMSDLNRFAEPGNLWDMDTVKYDHYVPDADRQAVADRHNAGERLRVSNVRGALTHAASGKAALMDLRRMLDAPMHDADVPAGTALAGMARGQILEALDALYQGS
jgi:hypothetical protein